MEANICDINHLGAADVLLPPRKRLLAGFRKQSCNGYDAAAAAAQPPVIAPSSSSASLAAPSPSPPPPSPSPSPPSPVSYSPSSVEFQNRLDNLLRSHFNNTQNLSPDQIVEASKSAANAAARAAKAARAAAQEKAILAAEAVVAVKSALALVASFPEEEAGNKEKYPKKNKLKKRVQVQLLYEKNQPVENYGDDEELARRLHRVINSSPRISRNSSTSGLKGSRIKRPKTSPACERTGFSNGGAVLGGNPRFIGNGHPIAGELDSEGSIRELYTSVEDGKVSRYENFGQLDVDNRDAESSHSREFLEIQGQLVERKEN